MLAGSLALFGMNEFAIRLPGLLFTLLGAITTGLLARQFYNRTIGWLATLICMTLLFPMAHGQIAVHDVILVPCVNLSILSIWKSITSRRTANATKWLLLAATFIALSMLAKGLIGVAIIGIATGLFAITGRKPLRCMLGIVIPMVVGVAVTLPWFLYVEGRDPGYMRYYFHERHFLGYVTSSQRHGAEPWFYYLPILFCGSIPWIFHTLLLGHREFRARVTALGHQPFRLLAVWLIGGVCFLSLARSKLSTYCFPLFPPMAIMVSLIWYEFSRSAGRSAAMSIMSWLLVGGSIAGIILPPVSIVVAVELLNVPAPRVVYVMSSVVSMIAVIGLVFAWTDQRRESFMVGCLWLGAMACAMLTWPFQQVATVNSQRQLANFVNNRAAPIDTIYWHGDRLASFVFYVRPDLKEKIVELPVTSAKELATYLAIPTTKHRQMVVTSDSPSELGLAELKSESTNHQRIGRFHVYTKNHHAITRRNTGVR